MTTKTQIYSFHKEHAHIVEFSGFAMPLWYKGIVPEALAVRNGVGIFDVSHMGRVLVSGDEAVDFLDYVTPNSVSALATGHGHYSVLCNQDGGIKDDIVVIHLEEKLYLVVLNAANRQKDLLWMNENLRDFKASIDHVSDKISMFAVQRAEGAGDTSGDI